MSISIENYINVKERAAQLECNVPDKIALLPRNFSTAETKSALIHESSVPTVRVLLRQSGLVETKLERSEDRFYSITERGYEWIAPTIFVSASLLSGNPHAVSIVINVISTYLTDWLKGIPGNKKVRLDVVVEKRADETCMRIHYEGNVDGLSEIPRVVGEVYASES